MRSRPWPGQWQRSCCGALSVKLSGNLCSKVSWKAVHGRCDWKQCWARHQDSNEALWGPQEESGEGITDREGISISWICIYACEKKSLLLHEGRGQIQSLCPRWLAGHPRNGAILGLMLLSPMGPQIGFSSLLILGVSFPSRHRSSLIGNGYSRVQFCFPV